jgi:hypothetical protein
MAQVWPISSKFTPILVVKDAHKNAQREVARIKKHSIASGSGIHFVPHVLDCSSCSIGLMCHTIIEAALFGDWVLLDNIDRRLEIMPDLF